MNRFAEWLPYAATVLWGRTPPAALAERGWTHDDMEQEIALSLIEALPRARRFYRPARGGFRTLLRLTLVSRFCRRLESSHGLIRCGVLARRAGARPPRVECVGLLHEPFWRAIPA